MRLHRACARVLHCADDRIDLFGRDAPSGDCGRHLRLHAFCDRARAVTAAERLLRTGSAGAHGAK
eukprot:2688906-Prymnesium_polylepis.2